MRGLLDFVATPEGQGLLSAVAGGLAGARRGTPLNNVGRGLLAGTIGYGNAQDRVAQQEQDAVQKQFRDMQMSQMRSQMEQQQGQQAWRQGLPDAVKRATEATYGAGDEGPTMTPADPSVLMRYAMDPRSPYADKVLESKLFPKEPEAFTLGPDQVRYQGGKVVAAGPAKPVNYNELIIPDGQGGFKVNDMLLGAKRQLARDGASKVEVNSGQALPPKFTDEIDKLAAKGLMDQYGDAKNAATAISAAQDVISLLDQGAFTGKLGPAKEALSGWYQAATGQQIPELDASQQLKTVIGDIVLPALSSLKGASSDRDFLKIEEYSRGESTITETALRGHMQRLMNKYGRQLEGFNTQFDAYSKQRPDVTIPGISRIDRPAGNLPKAPTENKPAQAFDSKPPAQQYKGKTMRGPDGKRYQSDGMTWKEVR